MTWTENAMSESREERLNRREGLRRKSEEEEERRRKEKGIRMQSCSVFNVPLEKKIMRRNEVVEASEAVLFTSPPTTTRKAAAKIPSKRTTRALLEDTSLVYSEEMCGLRTSSRSSAQEDERKECGRMLQEESIHLSCNYPVLLMIFLSEEEFDGVPFTKRVVHILAAELVLKVRNSTMMKKAVDE
eukprot:snap_masked-scaffold_26-processed-gene-2.33-mRNA-1 protein AED:1.00 eAED:1.00 QI:0/0/0/0/1/1/2/0/185